ncbi:MAG: flavin reductase family protein [Balneolales bacterium]|nr:flavin reductase family protein [Balneolales bacterium]
MSTFKSIDAKELNVREMQGLLTSAIAPRPICFASTIDSDGNVNLSPFSFFNVFSANPPVMIFSPARRGRDGTTKHTYQNIKEVPEVCISIVTYSMVEQISLASTEYAKGVNEFIKSGFTEVPSDTITPPRVEESPVSFECVVDQVIELGNEGGAGNLVLARVQRIHVNTGFYDDHGKLDTTKLDLVGRMGGNWYTHSGIDSLFEIPKPLQKMGIGIDQLPESIQTSNILTANNLGRLGNVERLPSKEEIMQVRSEYEIASDISQSELQTLGKKILEKGETEKALAILMS